jgi:hypothetical protein
MAICQYALLILSPITWVCGAAILVPTIVHRPSDQLGAVFGSAFVLRLSGSVLALLLTSAGLPRASPPLAGAMLFREPHVGVINAWLQGMTCKQAATAHEHDDGDCEKRTASCHARRPAGRCSR